MSTTNTLSIGDRVFGGYVVSEKLGEGGMGAVYAITNPALNRKLALKLLLPQWSRSPQVVQRFLAEARAASAIRHPNIIEILDASELANGSHYMLMEHLEGQSLEQYLRQHGPVTMETALVVLSQVCAALQAAHDRGIIHRDLKPANLFVSPTAEQPLFTKILDFGIAKLVDPSLAGDLRTQTNAIIGTPSYMSPEQARGAKDIDHRTDIYALSVIAYELLSGALPYAASSLGDLVYKQATSPPRDLAELRADLPEAWRATIMAALHPDPDARPGSAQAFLEQLQAATPNAQAHPGTVWLPPPAPAKRRRWALVLAIVAVCALVGGALGFGMMGQRRGFEPQVVAARKPRPRPRPKPEREVLLYQMAPMPPVAAEAPEPPTPRRRVRPRPAARPTQTRRPKPSTAATSRPSKKPKFDPNKVYGGSDKDSPASP